jgi:hypothetical protein
VRGKVQSKLRFNRPPSTALAKSIHIYM